MRPPPPKCSRMPAKTAIAPGGREQRCAGDPCYDAQSVTVDMLHTAFRALATALPVPLPLAGTQPRMSRFDFPADGGDCWYRACVDLVASASAHRDHGGVRSYDGEPPGCRDCPLQPRRPAVPGTRRGGQRRRRGRASSTTVPCVKTAATAAGCGWSAVNGVAIDHGGGWVTRYRHLRRDGVEAGRGARVAAGDVLGLIGTPGRASRPNRSLAALSGRTADSVQTTYSLAARLAPLSGLPG